MGEVFKSTISVQFLKPLRTEEGLLAMEAFCNETQRLVNWTLKEQDADGVEGLSYGWFQLPEEPGLYAVQVTGAHDHDDICKIRDSLQEEADERGVLVLLKVMRE